MSIDEEGIELLDRLEAFLKLNCREGESMREIANQALAFIDGELGHSLLNLIHGRRRDHGSIRF